MTIKSDIIGNEIFLQGDFLSIGVNKDGGLGTRYAAPTGYASDLSAGFLRVGMFADLDGFGQGAATLLHDAVLPGRTIEGFNIGYKTGGQTLVHSNQSLTGYSEIAGTVSEASTSTVGKANWKGSTAEKLAVSQQISLTDDAKFIRIDVTLTNNSGAAMSDVRYMRTADADHGSTFSTNNQIVRQGAGGALVASYANGTSTPFFMFSGDSRAVASTYGFVNDDPYAAAAYDAKQAVGYSKTGDQTINLTFGLGTLQAGQSTTVTLYMGVTNDLKGTIAAIETGSPTTPTTPVDLAPLVTDDALTVAAAGAGKGNVLANDRDPEGAKLSAALKGGPANGTVQLAADGSFTYTAKAGFAGVDQFTYSASDGKNATVGTVSVTVEAPVVNKPTVSPLLSRAGTVDGSSGASEALSGPAYHNTFYFDVNADSGADSIVDFGNDDVLVVNKALYDGNGDGIVGLSTNRLSLDAPRTIDSVRIAGTTALRFLGSDEHGLLVYADASVRPRGATESRLGDDRFTGDAGDLKKNVFFFDTALDIDLGDDRIDQFGARDLLVTTTKLVDADGDGHITLTDGIVRLTGGEGGPGDLAVAGEGGTIDLNGLGGAAVGTLEFDGAVVRNGTTYYVYSLDGSAVGTSGLTF